METDLRMTFYGQLFVQQIGTEEAAPRQLCQYCHRLNDSWVDQRSKESILNKITQFFETSLQFQSDLEAFRYAAHEEKIQPEKQPI